MLARRIIACLDVRDGRVVKGIRFEGLRDAGDPAALAKQYSDEGMDEIVILDVTATLESRLALRRTIADVARQVFVPLTVGGGVRTLDEAAALVEAGADKISINSAALARPALIGELADCFGSQAVIIAIDAKRQGARFAVHSRSGLVDAGRDAVEWAVEAAERGAGEILLTSMDADGTTTGFDCDLTARVSTGVPIPVIASGGAGTADHFIDVFVRGRADAALAASIFHYGQYGPMDLKRELHQQGITVRL